MYYFVLNREFDVSFIYNKVLFGKEFFIIVYFIILKIKFGNDIERFVV